MPRRYVFADEAGDFNFSRNPQASKYFILCTVTLDSCNIGTELMVVRRELAWRGELHDAFHATKDSPNTRNWVFTLMQRHDFRIDATIFEKSKAQPKLRVSEERFYKYAWFLHFKYVGPKIARAGDELFITAASLGTKKKKSTFVGMLHDVAQQSIAGTDYRVAFWPAASDPCLQIADYCTWAIQRRWERGDMTAYNRIVNKVRSHYDIFASGTTHYY